MTEMTAHPHARKARRRLIHGGISRGVEAIVEKLHPRPRGADCLPVADMERELTAFCADTVRLAVAKAYRDTVLSVQAGADPDVLLREANRQYESAMTMFDEDGASG